MEKNLSLEERINITPQSYEFRNITLHDPTGREIIRYDKVILAKKAEKMYDLHEKYYDSRMDTLNLPILYNILEIAWKINRNTDSRAAFKLSNEILKGVKALSKKSLFSSFFTLGYSGEIYKDRALYKGHDLSKDIIIHKLPKLGNLFFPLENDIPEPVMVNTIRGDYSEVRKADAGRFEGYHPNDYEMRFIPSESPPIFQWAPHGKIFTPGYKEEKEKSRYNQTYRKFFSDSKEKFKKQWQPFLRALFLKYDVTPVNDVLHWAFGEGSISLIDNNDRYIYNQYMEGLKYVDNKEYDNFEKAFVISMGNRFMEPGRTPKDSVVVYAGRDITNIIGEHGFSWEKKNKIYPKVVRIKAE